MTQHGGEATLFSLAAQDAGTYGRARALARGTVTSAASLHRGFKLAANVDLSARLGAELGRAAAARLALGAVAKAHIDLEAAYPLDLFSEAGIVARFAVGARGGVSLRAEIQTGLGVLVQALLADRFSGPYRQVLDVYLAELTLSAGFWAEIGFAAEARAEVRLVGSLLPGPEGQPPGFTFCFGHGAGWGVGSGADFVLDIGLADPARLLDRLADRFATMLVDRFAEVTHDLPPAMAASAWRALPLARFLFPLSARSAFELGRALTQASDARRAVFTTLVRCFAREAQEALARALVEWAIGDLYEVMRAEWQIAHEVSHPVAEMLTRVRAQLAILGEPAAGTFDDGFRLLLGVVDSLGWAADAHQIPAHLVPRWREGVAVLWSALSLLRALIRWTSEHADDHADPFRNTRADIEAGQQVAAYIASTRGIGHIPTLADLAALVADAVAPSAMHGGAAAYGRIVAWLGEILAPISGGEPLLSFVFTHLAEITPEKAWSIAPALGHALEAVVERELVPAILASPALMQDEAYREILVRVVVPAMRSLGAVMWPAALGAGELSDQAFALVLREQISAVLLQLVSRFVISAADVLSRQAHAEGAAFLRKLAGEVRAGGGQSLVDQILAAGGGVALGIRPAPDRIAEVIDLVADAIAHHDSAVHGPLFQALDELTGLALGTGDPIEGIRALAQQPTLASNAEYLTAMTERLLDATLEEMHAMAPEAIKLFGRRILG